MFRYYIKETTNIDVALWPCVFAVAWTLPFQRPGRARPAPRLRTQSGCRQEPVKGLELRSGWRRWIPNIAHTLHDQHLTSLGSWHSGEALSRQPSAPLRQYRLSRRLFGRLANQRRVSLTRDVVDEAVEASFGGVVVVHSLVGNLWW